MPSAPGHGVPGGDEGGSVCGRPAGRAFRCGDSQGERECQLPSGPSALQAVQDRACGSGGDRGRPCGQCHSQGGQGLPGLGGKRSGAASGDGSGGGSGDAGRTCHKGSRLLAQSRGAGGGKFCLRLPGGHQERSGVPLCPSRGCAGHERRHAGAGGDVSESGYTEMGRRKSQGGIFRPQQRGERQVCPY